MLNVRDNDQDIVETNDYPAVYFFHGRKKRLKKYTPAHLNDVVHGGDEAFLYFIDKNRYHQVLIPLYVSGWLLL